MGSTQIVLQKNLALPIFHIMNSMRIKHQIPFVTSRFNKNMLQRGHVVEIEAWKLSLVKREDILPKATFAIQIFAPFLVVLEQFLHNFCQCTVIQLSTEQEEVTSPGDQKPLTIYYGFHLQLVSRIVGNLTIQVVRINQKAFKNLSSRSTMQFKTAAIIKTSIRGNGQDRRRKQYVWC